MRRILVVIVAIAALLSLGAVAYAQMGWGQMGPGMMGRGPTGQMGPGMMGAVGPGAGQSPCHGGTTTASTEAITEGKAKELAQKYADQYLKGFTVEKVLPFTMMHGTVYSVELKGPKDEVRVLHINPFGNVMPWGGPFQAQTEQKS